MANVTFIGDKKNKRKCPYINKTTGNLVLRHRESPHDRRFEGDAEDDDPLSRRRQTLAKDINTFLEEKNQPPISPDDPNFNQKAKEALLNRDPTFAQSAEYAFLLKDENERSAFYRKLTVHTAIPEEEAAIKKNPLKFLYLKDPATLAQIRSAKRYLSGIWHPDRMDPENRSQLQLIFGPSLPNVPELSLEDRVAAMPPSVRYLDAMSAADREAYLKRFKLASQKIAAYEGIKAHMIEQATGQMQVINKAYGEAIKRFSEKEQRSFDGLKFEFGMDPGMKLYENLRGGNALQDIRKELIHGYFLQLEGDGMVALDYHRQAPKLEYGFSNYFGYTQIEPLRPFFIWMSLVQNQPISPTLLEDVADHYVLSDSAREQLRRMMENGEDRKFITNTLQLNLKNGEKKEVNNKLRWFVQSSYDGPSYGVMPYRGEGCRLGVEITPEKGLVLKLDDIERKEERFTPRDFKLMQVAAFGPLLE